MTAFTWQPTAEAQAALDAFDAFENACRVLRSQLAEGVRRHSATGDLSVLRSVDSSVNWLHDSLAQRVERFVIEHNAGTYRVEGVDSMTNLLYLLTNHPSAALVLAFEDPMHPDFGSSVRVTDGAPERDRLEEIDAVLGRIQGLLDAARS